MTSCLTAGVRFRALELCDKTPESKHQAGSKFSSACNILIDFAKYFRACFKMPLYTFTNDKIMTEAAAV